MQRIVIDAQLFQLDHLFEPGHDGVRSNAPEIEPLQPRQNRGGGVGDFLRFRGREHEHHARRRLFENLEERIPGFSCEHVRFVDDIDLRAGLGARRVHRAFAQVARVIDAAVGSGVELHDVEIGGTSPNAAAGVAHAAGFAAGRPLLAIQRHSENTGRRGLPDAAWPRKKVAVGHAALSNGAAQRRGDVVLDDQVGESLGPVFAR